MCAKYSLFRACLRRPINIDRRDGAILVIGLGFAVKKVIGRYVDHRRPGALRGGSDASCDLDVMVFGCSRVLLTAFDAGEACGMNNASDARGAEGPVQGVRIREIQQDGRCAIEREIALMECARHRVPFPACCSPVQA